MSAIGKGDRRRLIFHEKEGEIRRSEWVICRICGWDCVEETKMEARNFAVWQFGQWINLLNGYWSHFLLFSSPFIVPLSPWVGVCMWSQIGEIPLRIMMCIRSVNFMRFSLQVPSLSANWCKNMETIELCFIITLITVFVLDYLGKYLCYLFHLGKT